MNEIKHTKNNALADIEATDMLKDELYGGWPMTNDDTRNIAIRCVDRLVLEGYVKDCVDTNDTTEFSVQDTIHEEINKALNVKEDFDNNETCPTCDQHPYGDADDMCPVCGRSIGESRKEKQNE